MTTQEITEKANKMVKMGAKITFEQIVAMYEKKEKRANKSSKKWDSRKTVEEEGNETNNISNVECQNFFEEQRKNQMGLLY